MARADRRIEIARRDVEELVRIEAAVHYGQPPPPGRDPFVVVRRHSPVLISAPHGAITHRDNEREVWHQEDDYTASMALLLSERCGTSVIATLWRTDGEDPNYHPEAHSAYKRALKQLVTEAGVRWVIDLHASADASLPPHQLVDLGTRKGKQSLPPDSLAQLTALIERRLGTGTVSHNRFPAWREGRTITAYSHGTLDLHAVQVEMKSAVRTPYRRPDGSAYAECGPFSARTKDVVGMMQAIVDFVDLVLCT